MAGAQQTDSGIPIFCDDASVAIVRGRTQERQWQHESGAGWVKEILVVCC